jgi:hypothetical protein
MLNLHHRNAGSCEPTTCQSASHYRPGEAHDNRFADKFLFRLKSGAMLLADRGYDANWIRERAGKKGAWADIPPKSSSNDPIWFSPYLYRNRMELQPESSDVVE